MKPVRGLRSFMEQLQLFVATILELLQWLDLRRVPQQKDVVDSALVRKKNSAHWLVNLLL